MQTWCKISGSVMLYKLKMVSDSRIIISILIRWGIKDFPLSHRMARPRKDMDWGYLEWTLSQRYAFREITELAAFLSERSELPELPNVLKEKVSSNVQISFGGGMKQKTFAMMFLILSLMITGCARRQTDTQGPVISDVTVSNNVLVISDCISTSITISAHVTDDTSIAKVILWFRAGSEGSYKTVSMKLRNDRYEGIIQGSELLGQRYGVLEFHITAEDNRGNLSTSPTDKSIQFLPCVNN